MSWNPSQIKEGMIVTTSAGDRLGKVISCGTDTFVVEKGRLSPKDYELRYDHVLSVDSGGITYSLADLQSEPTFESETTSEAQAAAPLATREETTARHEVRIPLMEEEIGIEKIARESGHVRIHKTVVTEQKHFTVPVTREDVVIERLAASSSDGDPLRASEATFQEQTLDVPLYEEEVRVSKRPRLREQMVVRTVVEAVQKDASADLRHEEAEIEDTRTDRLASRGTTQETTELGYGAPGRR